MTDQNMQETMPAPETLRGSFPAPAMPTFAPSAPLTPMAMLGHAIASNAGLEMVEKLMDLQERHQRNEAVRAFNNAMADAKRDMPLIQKNRKVDFTNKAGERTLYDYEDLAGILAVVDPILGQHGLSVRFRTRNEANMPIVVTCVISHRDGYSEENTLSGPRDDSGKKNQLQQMGSTITYLQRYTLKAALGLASARDDDGVSGGDEEETQERVSPVEVDKRIASYKARMAAATTHDSLNDIGLEINREPKAVQDGLRAAWVAELARVGKPAPAAGATANGSGRMRAPPPPTEGNLKPGDAAWFKGIRAAFAAAKTVDELAAAWDARVEPVKEALPDAAWDEVLEGFEARKGELAP